MNKKVTYLIFPVAVVILLALDLIVKAWAVSNLMGQPSQSLISGLLGLTYHENTGAAFGIFANAAWGRWGLSVLKIMIVLGIVWYYYKRIPLENRMWLVRVPLILIVAGGLGNLYDRMTLGHVRDMLMFEFVNFPIFNVADIYVVVGCFFMAFVTLFVVKDLP